MDSFAHRVVAMGAQLQNLLQIPPIERPDGNDDGQDDANGGVVIDEDFDETTDMFYVEPVENFIPKPSNNPKDWYKQNEHYEWPELPDADPPPAVETVEEVPSLPDITNEKEESESLPLKEAVAETAEDGEEKWKTVTMKRHNSGKEKRRKEPKEKKIENKEIDGRWRFDRKILKMVDKQCCFFCRALVYDPEKGPEYVANNFRQQVRQNGLPKDLLKYVDLMVNNIVKLCEFEVKNRNGICVENRLRYYDSVDKTVLRILESRGFNDTKMRSADLTDPYYLQYWHERTFCCCYCGDAGVKDCLPDAILHLNDKTHLHRVADQNQTYSEGHLPPPASLEHYRAIGNSVKNVFTRNLLPKSQCAKREKLMDHLRVLLQTNGMDCEVEMFGSTAYGLAMKSSDFNINVSIKSSEASGTTESHEETMVQNARILAILRTDKEIRNIVPKNNANRWQVTFTTEALGDGIPCSLNVNNKNALLAAQLFQEYMKLSPVLRPVLFALRYWASILELSGKPNGVLSTYGFIILGLHFFQAAKTLPVLQAVARHDNSRPFASASEAIEAGFEVKNECSLEEIGKAWINLIRYFNGFTFHRNIVSINSPVIKINTNYGEPSNWNKGISIEDPIVLALNVARSIPSSKVSEFIKDRFQTALHYFAIPRTDPDKPLWEGIFPDDRVEESRDLFYRYIYNDKQKEVMKRRVSDLIPGASYDPQIAKEAIMVLKYVEESLPYRPQSKLLIESELRKLKALNVPSSELDFRFDWKILSGGKRPPLKCTACGSTKHLRSFCPEEVLHELEPMPYPNSKAMIQIKRCINNLYYRDCLTEEAQQIRCEIKDEIRNLLSKSFPDVELTLFGSSGNGFALRGSDLDLCMTLQGFLPSTKEEVVRYMENNSILSCVVSILRSSPNFQDIVAITTAKVPIVKFTHKATGVEGDICFYNLLALRNTKLLKAYTEVDPRVKILGCMIKMFGKICEISDASKGSLSSYGHMLMVIHYLQQTSPPVLPVLQKIPPIGQSQAIPLPEFIVENWNSYFYDNITNIAEVWEGYGKNTDTVDKLWMGYLKYFTETFDFDHYVITIAQDKRLTKNEKMWHTDCIAIEDPFVKTHNLGSGLSRRMSVFIIMTLRRFRKAFSANTLFQHMSEIRAFYMDKDKLCGKLPIDRQCRRCHRIGHIAKNCPGARRLRSRKDDIRDKRDDFLDWGSESPGSPAPAFSQQQNNQQLPTTSNVVLLSPSNTTEQLYSKIVLKSLPLEPNLQNSTVTQNLFNPTLLTKPPFCGTPNSPQGMVRDDAAVDSSQTATFSNDVGQRAAMMTTHNVENIPRPQLSQEQCEEMSPQQIKAQPPPPILQNGSGMPHYVHPPMNMNGYPFPTMIIPRPPPGFAPRFVVPFPAPTNHPQLKHPEMIGGQAPTHKSQLMHPEMIRGPAPIHQSHLIQPEMIRGQGPTHPSQLMHPEMIRGQAPTHHSQLIQPEMIRGQGPTHPSQIHPEMIRLQAPTHQSQIHPEMIRGQGPTHNSQLMPPEMILGQGPTHNSQLMPPEMIRGQAPTHFLHQEMMMRGPTSVHPHQLPREISIHNPQFVLQEVFRTPAPGFNPLYSPFKNPVPNYHPAQPKGYPTFYQGHHNS